MRRASATAFAAALLTSVLLWRIYVQRAGRILGEAVTRAAHPATIGRSAADTHLVMVIGVVATAIGYELVNEHPTGHNEVGWLAMILGGPALFLAGESLFIRRMTGTTNVTRLAAAGLLISLAPLGGETSALLLSLIVASLLPALAVWELRGS